MENGIVDQNIANGLTNVSMKVYPWDLCDARVSRKERKERKKEKSEARQV